MITVPTLVAVCILLIFASSVMFYAEREAQPEAFPSIPAVMWWAVVTLTTVGYGDIYPVTVIGKLFGAILAFVGIGLFALPARIIASGFSTEIQRRKKQEIDKLTATTLTPYLGAQQWTPEQKQLIEAHVERRAELMSMCIEVARRKFGDRIQSDRFEDEAVIRDIATTLYLEAIRNFEL